MKHKKALKTEDLQELFSKFAEPIMRAAKTQTGYEGGIRLAQSLFAAMLTGEEAEIALFHSLITEALMMPTDVEGIKGLYYEEMKPSITHKELSRIREYFNLRGQMEF